MERRDDLDRLEMGIKRLRIEFERFFNGALPTPPEELRQRIHRQIRDLRVEPLLSSAERFRLSNLEARYNTFTERFRRRLMRIERGLAPPRPNLTDSRASGRYGQPVILDPTLAASSVKRLWQQLVDDSGGTPAIQADLDTFRGYLARQLEVIRTRTGCDRVEMRVEMEGSRLKLKARPLPPAAEADRTTTGGLK